MGIPLGQMPLHNFTRLSVGLVTVLLFAFDPGYVLLVDPISWVFLLYLVHRIFTEGFEETAFEDLEVEFVIGGEGGGGVRGDGATSFSRSVCVASS